jgi:non-heme chloroperoxidase
MSMRSPMARSRHLLLSPLVSLGCADGQLVAAPVEEQPRALTSERIVGGGGVGLALYEAGTASGPPIVFIHGFTGNHLSWERQLAGSLAAEFRLVAYDLRGHGASDKPLDAARYTDGAAWADDLAAVIRERGLERPVLVGWSYGGYVIADYVRRHGDGALGGVVFLGAVTKNGTAEATGQLTDEVLGVFGDVLSADLRKSLDATRALTRMFANPLEGAAWEVAYGSAMMVPPAVRGAMFNRVLDNDDVLARIRVPALVVHGAADRLVRVRAAEHVARTVPGARLFVYDGVGHAPQLESPDRLARDLTEFVRAARRSRTP